MEAAFERQFARQLQGNETNGKLLESGFNSPSKNCLLNADLRQCISKKIPGMGSKDAQKPNFSVFKISRGN